ncbi:hypothetical protein QJS10_CPB13g00935 [Acorus calamus]|uniref:DUF4283 domain-containing protein n=1 Tax=Acorus calamus TaxID=4465 RepID=A0AAV9DHF2_ACOCL|nr:hypothetical protein QJS10_CPB13g00935 [Acorus calamus]
MQFMRIISLYKRDRSFQRAWLKHRMIAPIEARKNPVPKANREIATQAAPEKGQIAVKHNCGQQHRVRKSGDKPPLLEASSSSKAWNELFVSPPDASKHCLLEFTEPQRVEGVPKVIIEEVDYESSMDRWGKAVVGYVIEEDLARVLEGGPRTMDNRPFVLKKWSPSVRMEQERLTSIPIWVKFPNLPLHFWSKECLGKIASAVGTPLFMDSATQRATRTSYARVCVEVSADQPLPDSLTIESTIEGCEVFHVVYDWKPQACAHCHTFGHDDALCCKRPRTSMQVTRDTSADGFITREKGSSSHPKKSTLASNGSPKNRSPKGVLHILIWFLISSRSYQRFHPRRSKPPSQGSLKVANVSGEPTIQNGDDSIVPEDQQENIASTEQLPIQEKTVDETAIVPAQPCGNVKVTDREETPEVAEEVAHDQQEGKNAVTGGGWQIEFGKQVENSAAMSRGQQK